MPRALLVVGCCLLATPAWAGMMIPTLYNTGVGSDGAPLPGGVVDPHYQLLVNPNGTGPQLYVTLLDRFPAGYWFPDTALSQWISPQANYGDLQGDVPNSTFTYQTTFDLTGFEPDTASLTVSWATDNQGLNVLLNGASLGQPTSPISYYTGFSTFTVTGGFQPGVNTLDFVVFNGPDGNPPPHPGNPTGLRVELEGTAVPVPEPGTWVTLLAGGALLLLARRRWTKKKGTSRVCNPVA